MKPQTTKMESPNRERLKEIVGIDDKSARRISIYLAEEEVKRNEIQRLIDKPTSIEEKIYSWHLPKY